MLMNLTGCGNSDQSQYTITGTDGKIYESYQECCAANDYEAAHRFLARLQNSESIKYNEAKEYIFKNEALYLMSQNDETAKKRILYLLKEEGGNNNHVSMLVDLAIENDDEAFIKTLANQYSKGASQEDLKKLMYYLLEKPQEDNRVFIEKLFKKVEAENLLFDFAIDNDDVDMVINLTNQYDDSMIDNPKLRSYLISKRTTQLSNIILKNLPVIDCQRPPLGIKTFYGSGGSTSEFEQKCEQYKDAVTNFNNEIKKILNEAIVCKNSYLAEKVVTKVTPNIDVEDIGFIDRVHYRYKVSVDNHDVNSIKSLYNEAVRSGAFR